MKVFASLLCTAVFAVEKQSDLSHLFLLTDEDIESVATPPPQVTRRLSIFKSITGLEGQRRDDVLPSIKKVHGNSDLIKGITDEIIQEMRTALGLKGHLSTQCDNVNEQQPLSTTSDDSMVFESLLMMLSNPTESNSSKLWQQYLEKSIKNQKCSVTDLCNEFDKMFKCDEEGHLIVIRLEGKGPFDHLNLLMVPNTVWALNVGRTRLKTISQWSDLRGKSLRSLEIDRNPDLELNLDGLRWKLDNLPLQHLTVQRCQISQYFGLQTLFSTDPATSRVQEWMKSSALDGLRIHARNNYYGRETNRINLHLLRDGTYTRHER